MFLNDSLLNVLYPKQKNHKRLKVSVLRQFLRLRFL